MHKLICVLLFVFLSTAALAQRPESPSARTHFEKGLQLLRERSFEAALTAFEASAALDPGQPATFANIGSVSIALNRPAKAEAAFREAIKLAPANAVFRSELCRSFSLQKKHDAAIEACEEGVKLDPSSEAAYAARIMAYRAAGRPAEIVGRLVDEAAGRFRSSEMILVVAADHHLAAGSFEFAASLLGSLIALRPQSSPYHGMLAETLLRLGRDDDALASARTALRLEPVNPYANYAMGLIFFELGQHQEAIESLGKVGPEHPRSENARYYIALGESRRGQPAKAVDVLLELAAGSPASFTYQHELAKELNVLNRYAEAEAAYLKANELKPGRPEVHSGIGMAQMMTGRFEKAIANFEEAVRLKPSEQFYHMFLQVAKGRLSVLDSIPAMTREVQGKPKEVKRRLDLGRTLAFATRFDEAEKQFEEIYALDPPDPLVYHSIGVTLSEMGRVDKALRAYRKAIEKGDYAGSWFAVASIHKERGEFEPAAAAFTKGISLKSDVPNFMKLYADLLRNHGKRREALDMYKRSLALLPNNAPALYDAGVLAAKLGERETAASYLAVLKGVNPALARKLERCLSIWLPSVGN